ncbi:acyl-CoA dehydrogenase/oxidase C-terminal [Haematococcus lacustris]
MPEAPAPAIDARTRDLQSYSTARILAASVSPKDDITMERQRASFDIQQLTEAMAGGKATLQRRAKLLQLLSSQGWADKSRRHFLTREEEYTGGLQAALGIWGLMQSEGLGLEEGAQLRTLVDFPGGLELHIGMFIPSIRSQGTPEQQAHWLPLCVNLSIIGTYAQTELGHGTFVRGLETTATYDKAKQEFVLHSPTLTSTKWWPGGMGKTSTHAVVMARLFLDGKDYGPHAFIVQLRSLDTHLPMPGIRIGDIGPKFGYGGVDNGFMAMDHVRIPREYMLMRFAQVTPEGRYVPPPPSNSKASYATMVFVRADIVKNAGLVLARAVTIATRYAAVRRQTAAAGADRETQVLDYQNTSHTLLPLIAYTYALTWMGEAMMKMYKQFEKDRDAGNFSQLPELHALSSGLKALCTWVTADGIEACRRTCGGHGYSKLSGLPTLYQNYVQNVTWEGDNNVLCLQTSRFLLKALVAVQQGKAGAAAGSAAYLANVQQELAAKSCVKGPGCWDSESVQRAALQHVACRLAVEAASTLQAAVYSAGGSGLQFEGAAWNNCTVVMIRLARAHCFKVLHATMLDSVTGLQQGSSIDASAAAVLRQLGSLLALTHMEACLADFLEDGFLSGSQAQAMRQRQRQLLLELRPNAVGLVDALGVPDYLLHSALGRADGDVYQALLDMAQVSPLNATEEGPAWHSILKPVMLANKGKPAGGSPLAKL